MRRHWSHDGQWAPRVPCTAGCRPRHTSRLDPALGKVHSQLCSRPPLRHRNRRGSSQITLPPVSYVRHNPLAKRSRPEPARIDATPIEDRLPNLQPLEFEQVRRTSKEPLFNSLMEEHHYLGYEQPVGEHLKYLVWAQGRPVAC